MNESNNKVIFDPRKDTDIQVRAFLQFRETGKISLTNAFYLLVTSFIFDIPNTILNIWPGPIGMKIRQLVYMFKFLKMGKNVIIGTNTRINRPKNITVSDFVFIDESVQLDAMLGKIAIGRRVHIAPYSIINGVGSEIIIEDYAAIGAFARIYAHSEAPIDGKRMSGPMIPEAMKGMITAPIYIGKDGVVGTGAVVLPGVVIGEGAIVAANSLVLANTKIQPWTIYSGIPARFAGLRKKVVVEDV